MSENAQRGKRIDPWYVADPDTGELIRVLPAERVEQWRAKAWEYDSKIAVLCECAARLRLIARRALTESGETGDQARRELKEAIDWMARGGVERAPLP